jgi:F-box-like
MATSLEAAHETSDRIKQVQKLLDEEFERIKELKGLLTAAEKKVEGLQGELAKHQAANTPCPINDCPPEILSMIFKLSIVGSPEYAAQLLLVCKEWYNLVINDPQMWNTISIYVPDEEWDILSWAETTSSFVTHCLERSGSARLNIELDFTCLQTTKKQLIDRMHEGFWCIPSSSSGSDVDHDFISAYLGTLDYDHLIGNLDASYDCIPDHALDLIDELVGPEGEVIERWDSLIILFPTLDHDVLTPMIWEKLVYPAPNLSCLHLIQFKPQSLYTGPLAEPLLVWQVPRIKQLKIKGLNDLGQCLSFDHASVESLSVEMTLGNDFSSQLGQFATLKSLTLSPDYGMVETTSHDAPCSISLPRLQELVLDGVFDDLGGVEFNLPSLQRLVLKWGFGTSIPHNVRTVQPSQVQWAPDGFAYFRERTIEIAPAAMRGFLLHYTNSENLSVPVLVKGILLDLLKELSADGVLPPSWRTVSFHDTMVNLETFSIDQIVNGA